MSITLVVLQAKGDTRNTTLSGDTVVEGKSMARVLRRNQEMEHVGYWDWQKLRVHLWGFRSGRSGTENKHDLAPGIVLCGENIDAIDSDEVVIYGDALIIASSSKETIKPENFTSAEYTSMYTQLQGGYESEGDQDDSDDDDDDSEISDDEVVVEEEELEEPEADVGGEEPEEEIDIEGEPEPEQFIVARTRGRLADSRNAKKVCKWLSMPELEKESHDATETSIIPKRITATKVIHTLLDVLPEKDRINLEKGIFNSSIDEAVRRKTSCHWENSAFIAIYDATLYRVVSNLKQESYVNNKRLVTRLLEGEFLAYQIPFMAYNEIFPENWIALSDKQLKRETKLLEGDKEMATDQFRCSRCNKRQCTYYELQTRSADEPMTQFIRCLNCGKQWRQ